jgi:uncharacterized protein
LRFPDFVPRPPWWGGDLQTLRNALVGRPERLAAFPPEPLLLPLSDGSDDRLAASMHWPSPRTARPLVVLIHGLTGSEASLYILKSAAALLAAGYPVLRLNLRGAGPSRPLCRFQYHAGWSADLAAAFAALPDAAIRYGLLAVAFSLGGNMLLKFLGEGGVAGLRGAVAVSAPLDLAESAGRIMARRNRLYHYFLLAQMKRESLAGREVPPAERATIRTTRTIVEFDDRFTGPRNGYAGATDYYRSNSSEQFLDAITTPTLLIHALDDPWVPAGRYLEHDWRRNPKLVPLLPSQGGHVGFHGRNGDVPWHDLCIAEFFATL